MSETKALTFQELAAKGDGVLVKRGNVWTYPNAENDRSGTNLVLPLEYVSDAEVKKALQEGHLHAATAQMGGEVLSVRLKGIGAAPKVLNVVQAGTPEAGTELPPGSRVEHDAGKRTATAEELERSAAAQAKALKPEGAEVRHRRPHGIEPTSADAGARRGR
jgi:hypothetical protein